MKKWLSIIGAIGLTATSTTTLISCKKENNNKNEEENKPELPDNQQHNPQKPPKGSNWKLINGFVNEKYNDNKNYIGIIKIENGFIIIKWIGKYIDYKYQYINIYRWEGVGEPTLPQIDKNTGEITDWKEQKATE
ncbi:lipoprotein [Spiroplasma citri]|uniref:Lipoprotein n=1 Tax=Spiroplasma citri TaxID=2133 RepID=A0AAX3SW54_SPICI|nr:lipoprotein [Spiroplasma citri]WFG95470.1 lipoprotein [Spiroplasma citri]